MLSQNLFVNFDGIVFQGVASDSRNNFCLFLKIANNRTHDAKKLSDNHPATVLIHPRDAI